MLDVAAVAEIMIARFVFQTALNDALVLLTALHDLGKVNVQFRKMLRGQPYQSNSHWCVTEVLLNAHDDLLAERLGSKRLRREPIYAAVAGHHGQPSKWSGNDEQVLSITGTEAVRDAQTIIAAFLELWPEASLQAVAREDSLTLPEWFPAEGKVMPLADYLMLARAKAAIAIQKAGLTGVAPKADRLFGFDLRPMQSACAEIALPNGPTLAVIEDETGAGKTEAALILAQRMLCAGKGRGLFVALPTMATSDAMFGRLRTDGVIGRMFDGPPMLTLAHGKAGLSDDFRDLIDAQENAPEDPSCTTWLADGRRKALLGDVGVGTIDQALLAALPTKFHTLRHFALSSKILIVDEVHELGEPYIAEVLERLLQLHRQAGGSAILLTATLPLALRKKLMATYGGGDDDPAYPALSIAGGAVRRDLPQETGARGPVRVDRLPDIAAAVDLLVNAARGGAACVWVRNAVDDAIAAVQALRAAGVDADLLHARFALADRKRIEQAALARFGKSGQGRAGRVLVGTQILESSLDLDFDVMVSDLAPMAGLIQRAGRLWRHMALRPAVGRPVPEPVLHVVSPDPDTVDNGQWLMQVLEKGAYTYPQGLQWRTAKHLFPTGQIIAPSGLRGLIEAVHGVDALDVPAALEKADRNAEGKAMAHKSHAWQNRIDLSKSFREGSGDGRDADYPTRLGDASRTLALARMTDGRLSPWGGSWPMAEVAARKTRLDALPLPDQTQPAIAAVKKDWPDWRRDTVTVCPFAEDGTICEGLSYSADFGLRFG
ncbi:MAG: CRISPR-associated helicase/endonuclease Cas3 [Rhodobacteraceae bacterium PARR1]|nr:MAG: CRISPR-associated helicase/endonuclease Cas3 [Rhodobacteraceae bacterium PARR1]